MSEYIEREAAIARLKRIVEVNRLRTDRAWFTPDGVEYLINEIPAADVRPVVRCKDCKNYIERSSACAYLVVGMREDDFCSYGKRREES